MCNCGNNDETKYIAPREILTFDQFYAAYPDGEVLSSLPDYMRPSVNGEYMPSSVAPCQFCGKIIDWSISYCGCPSLLAAVPASADQIKAINAALDAYNTRVIESGKAHAYFANLKE